jgi:deoxyinosine 3'endonuclease (endonuclease V)
MCGGILRNGSRKLVVDDDRVIGEMVRANPQSPALCVSPGHKITLESAVMVTKKATKNVMPEPLKMAQEQLLKKLKA